MAKAVEFEIKIKGNGDVLKTLTVEATNANEAIEKIVDSASRAGDGLRRMAQDSIILDTATRAIQSLNEAVSGLAGQYNGFEAAMRAANTMAGTSGEEYDRLTSQIKEMGETIPLVREELADGLYQVISNGVPEDNWISFLDDSARAAVGGIADLGQTVTVTSTIIKNYGLEWSAAGSVQDKIQTTAKNGVTTFEQLSQALPRVTGSAAQLGVELNELMAIFATTTGVTGNTSEVSTQLAAVLTALIKPSSEASQAADAMGIKFNAASIKACGGFQNFLTELDKSIQEYAKSSGQLSETIYGQLFGSAEALRILGSLTGEQKDRFAANIAAMDDSAGTINAAFEQMSSTGEAANIIIKNQTSSWTDWAGAVASSIAPYMQLAANFGTAILGMTQIGSLITKLVSGIGAWNIATLAAAAVQKTVAIATQAWSVAQAALNAILTLNPVGLVVVAIGALVAIVVAAYKNSERFREVCDKAWTAVKSLAGAVLEHLVRAFEKVSNVVQTAWKWLKTFLGIDSDKPGEIAAALDRQTAATEGLADKNRELAATGLAAGNAVSWQTMSYKQLGEEIERQKTKVSQLAGVNAASAKTEADRLRQMEARYKALGKQYGLSDKDSRKEYDGKSLIAHAASYKELGNNITYYQNNLDKTDPAERGEIERLSKIIAGLNRNREAIRLMQDAYSQGAELETLSDIDRAIEHQRSLRAHASVEHVREIDAEILRLEELREAFERGAHAEVGAGQITTYRQLSREISYYESLLESSTGKAREEAAAQLAELKKLKTGWDNALADLAVPDSIDKLDSIDRLSEAISYYEQRMQRASASEIVELGRQKAALEGKRDMLRELAQVPVMQSELARLDGLSGKKLKMQLDLIGVDGIKDRIMELHTLLDNTRHPLGESERKEVERTIAAWRKYAVVLDTSNVDAADLVSKTAGAVGRLGGAIGGAAGEWAGYAAQVAVAVSQAIPAIAALVASIKAQANANAEAAVTGAAASVASIPVVGWVMAGAAIASVVAAMASIPKFANGGIAYGPTLGLFGEYAGASTNPEVVAPLSDLRRLVQPAAPQEVFGKIELVVEGTKLYGVVEKVKRLSSRR